MGPRKWRPDLCVFLERNTTWKCGPLERSIVELLREHYGRLRLARLLDLLGADDGWRRRRALEAIRRLERRGIVSVRGPEA